MKVSELHPAELPRHLAAAKAKGYDPEFLAKIVASAESPQHAMRDIQGLLSHKPPAARIAPQENDERKLDPHEAAIHEEMVSGQLRHFENGKLVE